jgi:hypothetical protein
MQGSGIREQGSVRAEAGKLRRLVEAMKLTPET